VRKFIPSSVAIIAGKRLQLSGGLFLLFTGLTGPITKSDEDVMVEYDRIVDQINDCRGRLDGVVRQIEDCRQDEREIRAFLDELSSEDRMDDFDASRFKALGDHINVCSKDDIRVVFKKGTEIKESC